MSKIGLAALVLWSVLAWAGTPNPADYTINIHVTRSRTRGNTQKLQTVINGKKYDLEGCCDGMLLATGDYKARLVKEEHKGTGAYSSRQIYELLFPDQKTRKFEVVGQSE